AVAVGPKVDAKLFIEETGKTGITALTRPGDTKTLAKMTAGDPVELRIEDQRLIAKSEDNEYLGQVEPRLARRLMSLMEGGNRYAAAVTNITDHSARIIIRETYQHSSQFGRVSFPKAAPGLESIRPYIKGTVLHYDFEEEEEEMAEEEYEEETEEEEVETLDEEAEFEPDLTEE
ncbi:MAG: hypothetical protein M1319_04585, partial [Chloroflexi bacterium]|nr:hypothetical protein [Chloroflexota bacterium]